MPINRCPNCGKEYAPHSAMCPPCNYWFSAPMIAEPTSGPGFDKRQISAFAGAGLLLVGLFTPLVGLPFFTFNYYNLGQFSSLAGLGFFLLLLCGAGAVALAFTKRYEILKWPGLAAFLIVAYTFFYLNSKISEAKSQIAKMSLAPGTANSPFKGMGEAFFGMIQMQWGWGVLAAGAVLLIVAGLIKEAD